MILFHTLSWWFLRLARSRVKFLLGEVPPVRLSIAWPSIQVTNQKKVLARTAPLRMHPIKSILIMFPKLISALAFLSVLQLRTLFSWQDYIFMIMKFACICGGMLSSYYKRKRLPFAMIYFVIANCHARGVRERRHTIHACLATHAITITMMMFCRKQVYYACPWFFVVS